MCRAPITRAVREIDCLEPACAEEDIIEFVRPFENCDLCKKRERPTLRCLECNGLVCENCKPVHSRLQSHHTVVSIFEAGVVVKRQVINNECKTHPNQTLDLYCLMCNTMLCLYCDKYAHSSCTSAYDEFSKYKQKLSNSSQLLQDFVYLSDERKTLIRTLDAKERRMRTERSARLERSFAMLHTPTSTMFRTMSPADQAMARMQNLQSPNDIGNTSLSTPVALRVVQVNEFSAFARNFIRDLSAEVEKDVEFYEEYIGKLQNIAECTTDTPELKECKESLETEIGEFIQKGKMISENNKLIERSTDVEVAESALRTEAVSLQFFRFRKPYSMDVRCVELTLDKLNDKKSILRQRAICAMQEHVNTETVCLFVDRVEVSESLLPDNDSSNGNAETAKPQTTNKDDEKANADETVTDENKSVFNTVKCLSVLGNDENHRTDNTLYVNNFLENASRRQELATDIRTIRETGFTGNHFTRAIENKCLEKCRYSKKRSYVNIVRSAGSTVLKYQTCFVNVFVAAPFTHHNNSLIRTNDIEKAHSAPIICLIGTRSLDSGLESLFLASSDGNGQEFTHGVSVRAKIARFKQTDFSCSRGTTVSYISVYKDKAGVYCLLKGMAFCGRSLVTYSTNVGESDNADVYYIPKDAPEKQISVSCFNAEILSEMKGGVFYVSRDEETGALVIGRLIMTGDMTKDTIFTVTEGDTTVTPDKLRPHTMAESRRGELVVACAVEGDASRLIMIVPMKQSVEILEIQYPDSEYNEGEVVDLEMDSDGNIMYIIKDVDGKIWRVITKYIMP